MTTKSKQINVTIDLETLRQLDEYRGCPKPFMSRSGVTRLILRLYLNAQNTTKN